MMRKDWFASVLVAVLFIGAAAAVVASFQVGFSTRPLRRLQPQAVAFQARLNIAQALLNDTLEYSKRNPAIDPLLQSLNLKTNAAPAGPAQGQPQRAPQ